MGQANFALGCPLAGEGARRQRPATLKARLGARLHPPAKTARETRNGWKQRRTPSAWPNILPRGGICQVPPPFRVAINDCEYLAGYRRALCVRSGRRTVLGRCMPFTELPPAVRRLFTRSRHATANLELSSGADTPSRPAQHDQEPAVHSVGSLLFPVTYQSLLSHYPVITVS